MTDPTKQTIDEILDAVVMYYASDVDVAGQALEMTTEEAKAAIQALIDEVKLAGKIEATRYAMQFAEKDPEYVTWDFLDGMLTGFEAERRKRKCERMGK